jgi:hypothetical protein
MTVLGDGAKHNTNNNNNSKAALHREHNGRASTTKVVAGLPSSCTPSSNLGCIADGQTQPPRADLALPHKAALPSARRTSKTALQSARRTFKHGSTNGDPPSSRSQPHSLVKNVAIFTQQHPGVYCRESLYSLASPSKAGGKPARDSADYRHLSAFPSPGPVAKAIDSMLPALSHVLHLPITSLVRAFSRDRTHEPSGSASSPITSLVRQYCTSCVCQSHHLFGSIAHLVSATHISRCDTDSHMCYIINKEQRTLAFCVL